MIRAYFTCLFKVHSPLKLVIFLELKSYSFHVSAGRARLGATCLQGNVVFAVLRQRFCAVLCAKKAKFVSWFSQDSTRVPVGNACILWYLPIITDVGSEEVSKTRQWEKYNDKIIYSCKIILIYTNIYGFVGKYEQKLPQTLRKTIQFCCFQIDFI